MPETDHAEPEDEAAGEDEAAEVEPAAADAATDGDDHDDRTDDDDEPAPVELPQRFDGSFRLGRFDGGATLVVDQGELRLQPDASLMAQGDFGPLTHREHVVRVYAARWQPPTSNTGVLVEDGDEVALVDLPGWDRKRLRASLAAAGFERDETVTDLRLGHDFVRPKKPWWD